MHRVYLTRSAHATTSPNSHFIEVVFRLTLLPDKWRNLNVSAPMATSEDLAERQQPFVFPPSLPFRYYLTESSLLNLAINCFPMARSSEKCPGSESSGVDHQAATLFILANDGGILNLAPTITPTLLIPAERSPTFAVDPLLHSTEVIVEEGSVDLCMFSVSLLSSN